MSRYSRKWQTRETKICIYNELYTTKYNLHEIKKIVMWQKCEEEDNKSEEEDRTREEEESQSMITGSIKEKQENKGDEEKWGSRGTHE